MKKRTITYSLFMLITLFLLLTEITIAGMAECERLPENVQKNMVARTQKITQAYDKSLKEVADEIKSIYSVCMDKNELNAFLLDLGFFEADAEEKFNAAREIKKKKKMELMRLIPPSSTQEEISDELWALARVYLDEGKYCLDGLIKKEALIKLNKTLIMIKRVTGKENNISKKDFFYIIDELISNVTVKDVGFPVFDILIDYIDPAYVIVRTSYYNTSKYLKRILELKSHAIDYNDMLFYTKLSLIEGRYPLGWAAYHNNVDAINTLLSAGAKVMRRTEKDNNETPIILAIKKGNPEAVVALTTGTPYWGGLNEKDLSGKTGFEYGLNSPNKDIRGYINKLHDKYQTDMKKNYTVKPEEALAFIIAGSAYLLSESSKKTSPLDKASNHPSSSNYDYEAADKALQQCKNVKQRCLAQCAGLASRNPGQGTLSAAWWNDGPRQRCESKCKDIDC